MEYDEYDKTIQCFCFLLEDLVIESLQSSYDFKYNGIDSLGYSVSYTFDNKSDQEVDLQILSTDSNHIFDKNGIKDVSFSVDDSVDTMTGSGDALSVINTVAEIIMDFMNKWSKKNRTDPQEVQISYSGTSDKSQHDPDSKRSRVYNKIFKKTILKKYPDMRIYKWDDTFTIEKKREDESDLDIIA